MTDVNLSSKPDPSLNKRIQWAVFALALSAYLIGLVMIGLPLREMTVRNLKSDAEREVSTLMVALQRPALLRNYAAVEQELMHRVTQPYIQHACFW